MINSSPVVDLIIPVRSIADGKRRLRTLLTAEQRQQLNRHFLLHAVAIARQLPDLGRIWVVSGCSRTLDLAHDQGACTLAEPFGESYRTGPEARLNEAMDFAFHQARAHGARDILVTSVDLPFAQAADLSTLCQLGRTGTDSRCAIATDRAGQGTNAIFIPMGRSLDFAFGQESCRRHADSARQHGMQAHIAQIGNLACDIDTPDDYLLWKNSPCAYQNSPTNPGGTLWMRSPHTSRQRAQLTASR